jgi:hypothetical protein
MPLPCPYCLERPPAFTEQKEPSELPRKVCPHCGESVPRLYLEGAKSFPPVVISAIGYPRHGKTVYCASLLREIKRLSSVWPGFYSLAIDEESLENVYRNMGRLKNRELPDATPRTFPRPMMLRLSGIPQHRDCTLVIYDTSGESFEKASSLGRYARFVARAPTAMFFVSVPDLWEAGDPGAEMARLLNTYLIGMTDLQADTLQQNLVVVLTKADAFESQLASVTPELRQHLRADDEAELLASGNLSPWSNMLSPAFRELFDDLLGCGVDAAQAENSFDYLERISRRLRRFVVEQIGANEFIRLVDERFRRVDFCLVSSLGAPPVSGRLVEAQPCRVLDPLLRVLANRTSFFRWLLQRCVGVR